MISLLWAFGPEFNMINVMQLNATQHKHWCYNHQV